MSRAIILGGDSAVWGYQRYLGEHKIADSLARAGWQVAIYNITGWDYAQILDAIDQDLTGVDLVAVSTTFLSTGAFGSDTWIKDLAQHQAFHKTVRARSAQVQFAVGGYYATHRDYRRWGWTQFLDHSDELVVPWTQRPKLMPTTEQLNPNRQFLTLPHRWQGVEQAEALPIEISRGCRFRCAFCRYSLNGRPAGLYTRTAESLAQEIRENWLLWGTRHYQFADDTLNESTEKIQELLRARDLAGVDFDFSAYIRLDLVESHPEQAAMLRDLGLKTATLGIETLNPQSASAIGKGRNPQRQLEFLTRLKAGVWHDVHTHSGFIVGLPHDSPEQTEHELSEFAKDTGPLDSVAFRSLGLMHPQMVKEWGNRMSLSEFDLDPKRWGYEWLQPTEWTNVHTGMTQTQAVQIAARLDQIHALNGKPRIAGFAWSMLYNLGISEHLLNTCSITEITSQFDITQLTLARIDRSRRTVYRPYSGTGHVLSQR